MTEEQLDDIDAAIVEQLYESPRMAFREIARRLEISEGTVRTRVKRLQESQLLQFTAFIDPSGIGHGVLGVALINVDPPSHDAVVAELVSWPEIVYLSTLFGPHGLQAQVSGDSELELWTLLQRMRSLPGVVTVDAEIEVKVHKIRYIPLTKSVRTG